VGETVERFSAAYVPPEEVTLGAAWEIGPTAVNPDELRLYRTDPPAGSGYANPGWKTTLGWCTGTRLTDGAPRALPAQLVYLGYHLGPGEPRLGMLTSSGLCCERTLERAVLGGLLEQIERDAIMLTWRLRMQLPRLDWERDPAFARVARLMRGVRPRLTLLDASAFLGIPVVMSVLRDPHATYPVGVVVGASAGLTVTEAADSAFREAFQTLLMASMIAREADGDGAGEIFDEHVARFTPPEGARRADFLTRSSEIVESASVPSIDAADELDAVKLIAAHLAERGVEAIAFDLTTVEVAGLGLHVARVMCPQLVWLDVDFDRPFDGRPRLDAVAREFGLPLDQDGRAVLNPDPHPLP
jgi:ribosomal protein S12 methylthiotransferase accessory factor